MRRKAMFRNCQVLLPTDFSGNADFARPYAVAFAKTYGGRIHLAHVVDEATASGGASPAFGLGDANLGPLLEAMEEHARARLEHIQTELADEGVEVVVHLVRGNPPRELVKMIDSEGCTLMVIASHGRRGFDHLVFGSVAERVVRTSPVPVLCVKHPEHEFVRAQEGKLQIKRVLYPTDFSAFCEKGMPFAESIAREFGATLTLAYGHEYPMNSPELMSEATASVQASLEESARRMLEEWRAKVKDVTVEAEMRIGSPYRVVGDLVKEKEIDLVVVPTHGRSGVAHMFLGSVAERIARHAPCPVLTLRPEQP
jgi:nucleotide-binding universal stress UspA family protein